MPAQAARFGFPDNVHFHISVLEVRPVEHKIRGPVDLLESEDVDVEVPGGGNVGDNKAYVMHAHRSCRHRLQAGLEQLALVHGGPF